MELYSTFGSREFQKAVAWIENVEFENAEDFLKNYGAKATNNNS
jgi:hypothetical protein